jgi:hypothetical protein
MIPQRANNAAKRAATEDITRTLVTRRTSIINQMRGLLLERGITLRAWYPPQIAVRRLGAKPEKIIVDV